MRVVWTRPAVQDLMSICDHSALEFGPTRARRTAAQIMETIEPLSRFPKLGRRGRKPGTLELAISGLPFVTVYRESEQALEILRILHGAQKWP